MAAIKQYRRSNPDGTAFAIDAHVGARVRLRRTLLGMSQEKLGEALELTFQQIQKYERGTNRISAGRLHDMCRILDVPIGFFFDGLDGQAPITVDDDLLRREILELARSFAAIKSETVKKSIVDLMKTLAHTEAD